MQQSEPLLGAAEVARIVKRHATTVQRWALAGRLPIAQKMPGATGALLFARADVEALAEELKGEALAKEPAA